MSPKKRQFTAAEPDEPPNTGAAFLKATTLAWVDWRQKHPRRCPQLHGPFKGGRPPKNQQKPYHIYEAENQTWLMVPMARRIEEDAAQSLTGTETALFRYTMKGDVYEHYTNIHRIETLAKSHPMVMFVVPHKPEKALDETIYNEKGRATKYHQSPHDLRITFAASGATFTCGVTVNQVHNELLSLWFQPGKKAQLDDGVLSTIHAVFYDICEAEHQKPSFIPAAYWSESKESGAFQTIWAASLSNMF